jgi:uncharacterized protein YdeI (YjbR/CyaY-like superfamily)
VNAAADTGDEVGAQGASGAAGTPGAAGTFYAPDRAAWRAWLEENHAGAAEVWLLFYKKHTGEPCVTLDEAVEEAMCFGWVDSLLRRIDDRCHKLRFTPRKPGGQWAQSNKDRVERLTAAGRMAPAGLAVVDAAKADGSWDALTSLDLDTTPPDLKAALARVPEAARRWRAWPPSHRRAYIGHVLQAKRPETRARRIDFVVRRAAAGLRPGDELGGGGAGPQA